MEQLIINNKCILYIYSINALQLHHRDKNYWVIGSHTNSLFRSLLYVPVVSVAVTPTLSLTIILPVVVTFNVCTAKHHKLIYCYAAMLMLAYLLCSLHT